MAFESDKMQVDVVVAYEGIEYRVLDTTDSGLLLVVKEEDVKNKNYPLIPVVIPDKF